MTPHKKITSKITPKKGVAGLLIYRALLVEAFLVGAFLVGAFLVGAFLVGIMSPSKQAWALNLAGAGEQVGSGVCPPAWNKTLSAFYESKNWHRLRNLTWMLTQHVKFCADKQMAFFSDFVQKDQADLPFYLVEFRQNNIEYFLWPLASIGVTTQNKRAIRELKQIAMNKNINGFFRVKAVEALGDMSLFMQSPAESLYEIVRDLETQPVKGTSISSLKKKQEVENQIVQEQAFNTLTGLVGKTTQDLSHELTHITGAQRVYWETVLLEQALPEQLDQYALDQYALDQYARATLQKLKNDPNVPPIYHQRGVL